MREPIYVICGRLYDNTVFYGYRLLELKSGGTIDEDISQVKILAKNGLIYGVTLDNKGNLYSIQEDIDLRKLKRIRMYESRLSSFETGFNIRPKFSSIAKYKPRYIFDELMNYLVDGSTKVCVVCGLRRTGKTVLLLQAINKLGYRSCAYISMNKHDKSLDLLSTLKYCKSSGIRYVFIDEITVLDDVLCFIATLADNFTLGGMKIVISGTDSYMLELSSTNELYDRCVMLHTTYVSFKEYDYLFNGVSIEDYIRLGGVLQRDTFYDSDSMHRYLSTAISDNIQHTVEVVGRHRFGMLHDMIDLNIFKRCLELAIQSSNEELTVKILADNYKSRDLGSLFQLLSNSLDLQSTLNKAELNETLRYHLRVRNLDKDKDLVGQFFDTFMSIFECLGLVVESEQYILSPSKLDMTTNILFTLPGLRYNQMKELFITLLGSDKFQCVSKADRGRILSKLQSDVYGQLMEQVVLLGFISCFTSDRAYKVRAFDGRWEIDCVVEVNDREIDLFEVKWSKKVVRNQCKHLIDKNVNNVLEDRLGYRVRNRYVVYRGSTQIVNISGFNIKYINVNELLRNLG